MKEIKDIPSRGKVFVVKNINEGSCQEIKDIPSRGKVFVVKNINTSATLELNRYQLRPCSKEY